MSQTWAKLGIAKPKLAYCEPWNSLLWWSHPNQRRSITIRNYKPTTVMIASLVDDLDEDATRAVYMVVRELHDRKKPQKQNTIQMTWWQWLSHKNAERNQKMNKEQMIEDIVSKLREADTATVEEVFWFLELDSEGWKEVIHMYLIHRKGVWTHRNATVDKEPQLLAMLLPLR